MGNKTQILLQDSDTASSQMLPDDKVIYSLYARLSQTIDLHAVLDLLVEQIRTLADIDGCIINLINEDKNELCCEKVSLPSEYDGMMEMFLNLRYSLDTNDINVDAYKKHKSIIIDSDGSKRYSKITSNQFFGWKCHSMASIPIQIDHSAIGTIVIFKQNEAVLQTEVDAITDRLIPIFYNPVKNTSQFLGLKRKETSISRFVEEQKHFLRFILDVNKLTNIDSIFHLFCSEILRRFNFDLAGILLIENDKLVARKHAILDEKYRLKLSRLEEFFQSTHYELNKQDGACLVAMDHNIHVYIPDCSTVSNLPMSQKDKKGLEILETPRSMLIMPIRKGQTAIGAFWLWSLEKPVQVDDTTLNIIDLLGSFIGTAISNAELYCQVEDQKSEIEKLNFSLQEKVVELNNLATTDKLTELKNFAFFQQELQRRIMEYRRCVKPLCMSLIIIDIDHFKRFNDTYGHVAGNIALMDVAGRIAKQARSMDIVCRYGGEEFIVILPKCQLNGAYQFAERVRAAVEASPVKTDKESVPVTISIGVAEYQSDEEQEHFIERADKALYEAKQSGRNCVKVAQ